MATPTGPDAREHPRASAKIRVEYQFGSTSGVGHTIDVSEGGLFLSCSDIAEAGTRIYLRLYLPGSGADNPLKIIGEVRHSETSGMGIHFEVAYSRTREALARFLHNVFVQSAALDIEPLAGTSAATPGYGVRFANSRRNPMLSVEEVSQAFSFDSPPNEGARPWSTKAALRVALVALALATFIYFVLRLAGALN
jgi:hypothetical protein